MKGELDGKIGNLAGGLGFGYVDGWMGVLVVGYRRVLSRVRSRLIEWRFGEYAYGEIGPRRIHWSMVETDISLALGNSYAVLTTPASQTQAKERKK